MNRRRANKPKLPEREAPRVLSGDAESQESISDLMRRLTDETATRASDAFDKTLKEALEAN